MFFTKNSSYFGFGIENKEEYTLDKSKDLKLKIGEMEENMTPLNVPDLELEEIPDDEDDRFTSREQEILVATKSDMKTGLNIE